MVKIKLIAADMDGTLLNQDSALSERTTQAVKEVQELGIKVVLASGRNLLSLTQFVEQLELKKYDGWLVGVNGQQITRPANGHIEVLKVLEHTTIKKALAFAIEHDLEFMAVQDDTLYAYLSERLIAEKYRYIAENQLETTRITAGIWLPVNPQSNYPYLHYINSASEAPSSCNKIIFTEEPERLAAVKDQLAELFAGKIDFSFTTLRWLEGMPAGISKGAALKQIAVHEAIDLTETMAFGDGENDISMLEVAGTAVVMENALASVKEHADILALSNLNDGVAVILEELALKMRKTGKF